ncbi:MAG TPA: glycosyltransferase family 39 protein [Gemmatimonadales bacterium]|nr:glycosyltransferase family 39 protein [Gemmatimonadales bacterium]
MTSRRRLAPAGLAAVVLLFLVVATRHATAPHDWNGALMSAGARNHLTLGYGRTMLGAATNNAPAPARLHFYTSHPPGLPLLLSVSFASFGVHEWSARLVPVGFAAGSIVLVYLLALGGGAPRPLLPAALFALTPMTLYYGREVCHEAPTAFFLLLAALGFQRWESSGGRRALAGTVAALAAGMLIDWPAYLLAGALPAVHLLRRGWRGARPEVLLLPAAAVVGFAGHLTHVALLSGEAGLRGLLEVLVHRAGAAASDRPDEAGRFSSAAFAIVQLVRAAQFFTPVVLVAGVVGLASLGRARARPLSAAGATVLALLLVALLHVVLFRQGAWIHPYWLYYFGPPLALAAAPVLLAVHRRSPAGAAALGLAALAWSGLVTRNLFRYRPPPVRELARFVEHRAGPETELLTNHGSLSAPVGFYARRDAGLDAVAGIPALEAAIAGAGGPVAVLVDEGHHGAGEIGPWLERRARAETWTGAGRRYRLYLLPQKPRKNSSAGGGQGGR